MNTMYVLLPLCLALAAAPLTVLVGAIRPAWAAWAGGVLAALAFGTALWGWTMGGASFDAAWAPAWNLRLSFTLDGLAALYTFLATGIGVLIVVYSARYMPLHLEHEGQTQREQVRFYGFLLLFMGAMVGLVMAQDMLLVFVFWDITAIASYYLIGYDRQHEKSRISALMALLVTGISSVCFLIGALLLYGTYETFSIPVLLHQAEPGVPLRIAGLLIALAALAKSAQVPLHFWLPRAMAAPTPVSAYLHSAAMVAAGVFLLGRFYPLLQKDPLLLNVLLVIGLLSMGIGGVLALTRDVFKQLLAYSTIAQYGYVVTMFGLAGSAGASGAAFYVMAHALCKSALFLTAGAVTEATGQDRLSQVGGLWRSMPLLAVSSGATAAGLAAFPLTIGFFKDELFFAAALERGSLFVVLAVVGAAFTLAYTWRFWSGIFLGSSPTPTEAHAPPLLLVVPITVLGLLVIAGGIITFPFAQLAESAGVVMYGAHVHVPSAYHLDTRPENLMAVTTFTLGAGLIIFRRYWQGAASLVARLGEIAGPERWYFMGLHGLNRLSRATQYFELRDLRWRIASVLASAAVLVVAGLMATAPTSIFRVSPLTMADLPLLLALLLALAAAVTTLVPRGFFTLVLALSSLGYSLAGVYAFIGGPDVALVAVLVETVLTMLVLGALMLVPPAMRTSHDTDQSPPALLWRNILISTAVGGAAFAVAWSAFSTPRAESVAAEHIHLTPEAHASDVVTAILADFRGLDTLGEISVIVIALLGIVALLQQVRSQA